MYNIYIYLPYLYFIFLLTSRQSYLCIASDPFLCTTVKVIWAQSYDCSFTERSLCVRYCPVEEVFSLLRNRKMLAVLHWFAGVRY